MAWAWARGVDRSIRSQGTYGCLFCGFLATIGTGLTPLLRQKSDKTKQETHHAATSTG